jgi:hypothetical protein
MMNTIQSTDVSNLSKENLANITGGYAPGEWLFELGTQVPGVIGRESFRFGLTYKVLWGIIVTHEIQ